MVSFCVAMDKCMLNRLYLHCAILSTDHWVEEWPISRSGRTLLCNESFMKRFLSGRK